MTKRTLKEAKQEEWKREDLEAFLVQESQDGTDPDFESLMKASKHMVPEAFAAFLILFLEEGRNLRATNRAGQTVLDVIRTQSAKGEYVTALSQAMSQAS